MKASWLLLLVALGCNARGNESSGPGASATASGPPAVAAAATPGAPKIAADGTCQTELRYLVPPEKHGESDLIRAIAIDGGQVFYRDMHELFRVPLAGGAPTKLGKAPELSLRGTTVLWVSGDKLLTQSPGEPIFMSSAKAGGAWSNIIDLTAAKLGGGRDATTRILQGLGKSNVPHASDADFDGQTFYFSEVTSGKGANAPSTSKLESVALGGGQARTLYECAGDIQDVTRAGDRLAFMVTKPPTAEQIKQQEADRKTKRFALAASGESHLMSVPLTGGEAKELMRISGFMASAVLGADGKALYVSGYRDEDLAKPGIFRVDTQSGEVVQLDRRALHGSAFVSGDSIVLIGGGMVEPGKTQHGHLVLSGSRRGKSLSLVSCITDKSTLHAKAVQGKVALLSLFQTEARLASIVQIALP